MLAGGLRVALLTLALGACAKSHAGGDDAGNVGDDAGVPADAAVDAAPPPDAPVAPAPTPGAEVVSAGGTVRSGTVTMDVEIGHWVDQARAQSGPRSVEGGAVIKP
ncbi:MAG TPA: hypothetical protein VL172_16055 [Kofleriaceae bacterium]|nr:hypothetical protein [Kofleriaceae bacterium]